MLCAGSWRCSLRAYCAVGRASRAPAWPPSSLRRRGAELKLEPGEIIAQGHFKMPFAMPVVLLHVPVAYFYWVCRKIIFGGVLDFRAGALPGVSGGGEPPFYSGRTEPQTDKYGLLPSRFAAIMPAPSVHFVYLTQ